MLVATHSVQSSFKELEEGLSTHTIPMHGMLPKDSSNLKSSHYVTDTNLIKQNTWKKQARWTEWRAVQEPSQSLKRRHSIKSTGRRHSRKVQIRWDNLSDSCSRLLLSSSFSKGRHLSNSQNTRPIYKFKNWYILFEICLQWKNFFLGHKDGTTGTGTCCQVWQPELGPWNQHGEMREPTFKSCSRTAMHPPINLPTKQTRHIYKDKMLKKII